MTNWPHHNQTDLEFAEDRALRVCGLAWTNEDASAMVNAFGPLAFCKTSLGLSIIQSSTDQRAGGRYLTRDSRYVKPGFE